jgi:hypothetical protein
VLRAVMRPADLGEASLPPEAMVMRGELAAVVLLDDTRLSDSFRRWFDPELARVSIGRLVLAIDVPEVPLSTQPR